MKLFFSYALYLVSYGPVSCILCPVLCILCPVSCILCPISCILCPVLCILCPCIMYLMPFIMYILCPVVSYAPLSCILCPCFLCRVRRSWWMWPCIMYFMPLYPVQSEEELVDVTLYYVSYALYPVSEELAGGCDPVSCILCPCILCRVRRSWWMWPCPVRGGASGPTRSSSPPVASTSGMSSRWVHSFCLFRRFIKPPSPTRRNRQKRRLRSLQLFGVDILECRTSHLAARILWRKVLEEHPFWEGGDLLWCEPDNHPFSEEFILPSVCCSKSVVRNGIEWIPSTKKEWRP